MGNENVELALRQLELWNSGDTDEFMRCFTPDVVVDAPEGWPEGSASHGLDAWREQSQRLRDTWKEARIEVDEIRSVGDDRVVARIRYITSGRDAGIAFDTPMAVVVFFKDRKIARMRYFWEIAQALEAAESPE